jgi:integrase
VTARTVSLYRDTFAKALGEELGTVRLTDLTAGDVQTALTAVASRSSTRTVQIAHDVLVRTIRQAERDDLVGRNVAALVEPPKGQLGGRPSKSLTLEQAVALMAAACGARLEAYITLSLLTGLRTEEVRALRWDHVVSWVDGQWQPVSEAGFDHEQLAVLVWRADRAGAIRRRRSPAGRWRYRVDARRHCGRSGYGRLRTGSRRGRCGRITTLYSRRPSARRWMTTMYGGSSGQLPKRPAWARRGCRESFGTRSCRCCRRTACR